MGYNHARVYSQLKNANLLAVADISKTALKRVTKRYNTKGFTDYMKVLEMPEIDAVSVCVPTTYHYKVTMDAIEHGKHVLVEKPIAFTVEEAKEMIKFARKKNVKLSVGHVERFNPAVQKAKEVVESGTIGDIVTASTKRVGPFPPRIKDVGVTIDLAIHDIDIMHYLFEKKVVEVYAYMGSILNKCEFEDHAEIMVKFQENIVGLLEVNWLTPYKKRKLSITGTDGIISVDYITQNLKVHGKFAQNITINKEEPLKNELRSFVNSVLEDKEPPVNGESGLYALKVVLNAIKSAKKGYPVRLEGGKNE